jgi:calcium-dependent protein kinase
MEDNQEKMFERVKHGDWKFDEDDWGHISKEAKDLISCMLVTNADARITAADALRSKWINQDASALSSRDLSQSAINMRERRPRLQDLARAFMALGVGAKKVLDSTVNPIQGEDGSHQLL